MKIFRELETWNRSVSLALAFALIAGIGVVDWFTGSALSLSLFYLLPIALLAWKGGRWLGLAGSLASVVVWLLGSTVSGAHPPAGAAQPFPSAAVLSWDAAARFLTYGVLTLLISSLRGSISHLEAMSRTDHLTGAANARAFREQLKGELERSRRYHRPFTISYLDLDNFKNVNDSFGHATGDALLRTVVDTIRGHVRATDLVARLGGDEFALLLPEADLAGARTVVDRIRSGIQREMETRGWPVTVSAGSLTCLDPGLGVEELVKKADEQMYAAKLRGKNMVTFISLPPREGAAPRPSASGS